MATKLDPKKVGKGLSKKVGPLPLWLWLGIATGTGLALLLYLRGRGTGGGTSGPVELVTGADPYQQASAGAPPQNSAPAVGLAPEVAAGMGGDYYPDNKLRQAAMQLVDELRGYQGQFAEAAGGVAPEWWVPEENPVVDATLGAPGTSPAPSTKIPGAPQATSGVVRYGGRKYTTKQTLGAALAGNYAGKGNPGLAYRDWAKKHPQAAAGLKGAAPPLPKKSPPQKKPSRSVAKAGKPRQPKQRAAAKPKPRRRPPAQRRMAVRR